MKTLIFYRHSKIAYKKRTPEKNNARKKKLFNMLVNIPENRSEIQINSKGKKFIAFYLD